jgi:hypothetical protein
MRKHEQEKGETMKFENVEVSQSSSLSRMLELFSTSSLERRRRLRTLRIFYCWTRYPSPMKIFHIESVAREIKEFWRFRSSNNREPELDICLSNQTLFTGIRTFHLYTSPRPRTALRDW